MSWFHELRKGCVYKTDFDVMNSLLEHQILMLSEGCGALTV